MELGNECVASSVVKGCAQAGLGTQGHSLRTSGKTCVRIGSWIKGLLNCCGRICIPCLVVEYIALLLVS